MYISPTTFNYERADKLAAIIRAQAVLLPTRAPLGYPQVELNPWFRIHLCAGNYPTQKLANAVALVEVLEDDTDLRRQAADQMIEVEDIRDMIADATDYLADNPYPSGGDDA